ncbi:hypothetical protein CVIRNUC_008261 [Coccomyxa viridis]|uniref:VTT domain-containing protein n=1 Tax=Coccomyxa viridis TaxID=1274662 RepID=A0AAV1ICI4_9CHLO|nr:hypothetical protein CVIRNUC_008261 [Coccomyxa viridis]
MIGRAASRCQTSVGSTDSSLPQVRRRGRSCLSRETIKPLAAQKGNPSTSTRESSKSRRHNASASSNGNGNGKGRGLSRKQAAGNKEDAEDEGNLAAYAAPAAVLTGLAVLIGVGVAYKHELKDFIEQFVAVLDTWGPVRYPAYGALYTLLEVLALPAVPLTMTAGLLFGVGAGAAVVSVSATIAATISFLIARYAARDRIQEIANKNAKFKAIDKAIGRNSLKIVTLLRLSPLLPLALSNYLYGLTSVDLGSYVLGSWAGMLPGTIAYVAAGSYGRQLLDGSGESLKLQPWQIALGLAFTVGALGYIGRIAKDALEEEEAQEQ